jgi:hypothetical protein
MHFRNSLLLLCCLTGFQCLQAQSFQKILRKSDNSSHYCRKLLRLSDTEYAFLTSTELYRIDQQGAILKQVSIGHNGYDLQDLGQLTNGLTVIAGGLYTGTQPAIKLTRLDANGQVLRELAFDISSSFDNLRLVPSTNNRFFLVFVQVEQQRRHPAVMYFDQDFNILWERHLGFDVYNEMNAIAGNNGGVEFLHMSPGDMALHHFKCDTDGNITEQPVAFTGPQEALTIIRRVIKTPNGGYLYSGVQLTGVKNDDILLLKTDDKGNTEWVKKHDFYLGDIDDGITVTGDGYMILARVGYTSGDLNQNNTDMALVKLDAAGETVWIKSYGSPAMDYSRSLLIDKDGNIFIGGQSTTYYTILTEPVLLKTNVDGIFPEYTFPHPLLNPSGIVSTNTDPHSPIQRLTNGALLPDGGMVMAASLLHPGTDEMRPYITRADAKGNVIWHQEAPGNGVQSVMMKPMKDGSFLSITEVRNPLFVNDYFVSKLDADGRISWTKKVYANYIKDAVMAPDGGYLLCGMEHEGTGSTVRMLCVIKLNQQGDEQWKYKHRLNSKWIYGRSIQITPDNQILVTGFMQEMQDPACATYLSKLDLQGTLQWYKTFPRGNNMAVGNKVIVTSTNDYLVTGYVRYPGEPGKQDLLLLKTDATGRLLWEKEYHIDKMDAGISVIEYGGQYYIAGTTGQPEFGAKESFGVLFRTDVNGMQKGFTAFGNKGNTLTCTDLYSDTQKKFHFMGTVQQPFGTERPFQAVLEPDVVLSITDPTNDRSVQLYPMPATNTAFALIDHSYTGPVQVSITGISGVQFYNHTFRKTQQQFRIPLPVAGYVNGVYLVELRMGHFRITKKLVIGK